LRLDYQTLTLSDYVPLTPQGVVLSLSTILANSMLVSSVVINYHSYRLGYLSS